jgi:hypothetical protein
MCPQAGGRLLPELLLRRRQRAIPEGVRQYIVLQAQPRQRRQQRKRRYTTKMDISL